MGPYGQILTFGSGGVLKLQIHLSKNNENSVLYLHKPWKDIYIGKTTSGGVLRIMIGPIGFWLDLNWGKF